MSSNSERPIADRYVLRRELGRGGMGIVWEAHDTALDRVVAIKQVLLPGHFTDAEREDAHARVRREARSAARISHPTVITIHDVFEYEHDPWVVMELVEGGSLQDLLSREGALPPERVADIAESLLQAVRAADQAGVLHRDIKPGNIMMSSDGRVILTDFGIATMEDGPSITRTGALIGSPEYMPPERLEGGPAEHRGDLWSIGVTLYAAVEGTSPFRRDSITAAIAAVISSQLPPMTRAGWLEPVITGLLERDPDRRLTVDQALELLERCRPGSGPVGGAMAAGGFVPSGPQEPIHEAYGAAAPPRPHPPYQPSGPRTPHPEAYSHGGGYYGQGAYPSPAEAYGEPVAPRPRARRGPVIALFAAAAALLLVAGIVVAVAMRGDGSSAVADGGDGSGSESRQEEAQGGDGQEGEVLVEGSVPEYDEDELRPYDSEWFTISYPGGWTVTNEALENSYASFVAPGMEHQLTVDGWEETDFTGTSAEFLEQTRGGTDIDGDETTGYQVRDTEDFDRDDFEGGLSGLDVALVEADLVNSTWDHPERRFWAYAVVLEEGDHRVFYLVTVNVPREQADDFDEIHEDVIETFTPLR
ncbi:serine/threonine-protein kinase [Nocardiopsis alkaliphila]|uniref:serine/threonine-protein kinase n=1 Tax=Nocardiopsis alkaliphila TaxID=225762 RepID=UPI000348236C|nr:serine/threonine-protein kinase [Nocardiopsis alkaliphila]